MVNKTQQVNGGQGYNNSCCYHVAEPIKCQIRIIFAGIVFASLKVPTSL